MYKKEKWQLRITYPIEDHETQLQVNATIHDESLGMTTKIVFFSTVSAPTFLVHARIPAH